jgi:hypothetical protein
MKIGNAIIRAVKYSKLMKSAQNFQTMDQRDYQVLAWIDLK